MTDVLLIGGGVASASAAGELRAQGFTGSITLASREMQAPYHRPPITKELLAGGDVDVAFHPDDWWQRNGVELLTRSAVASLDLDSRTATLATKREIAFKSAILATGAMVRRLQLDGAQLDGIHYLRTPANAARLRSDSEATEHVVVVGGSFIATEVAASFAARGTPCTLVMQERGPLARSFGAAVSGYVADWLTERGVRILPNTDVMAFVGDDAGHVRGVRTNDGHQVAGDLVVVGAGAVPDVKLAERAGLEIGVTGGVRCNTRLETSTPGVFAAGDVCEYDSLIHGRPTRVEHEQHAIAQGITAARNVLGRNVPYMTVPYFWTDLIGLGTLEYVGAAASWTEEAVTGSPEAHDFTVWYRNEGELVGALTCGRPDELDRARQAIANRAIDALGTRH